MRNSNGMGCIAHLGKNRKRPYAVKITTHYSSGTQTRKYLSYHATKKEALVALSQYNKGLVNLDYHRVTFSEIFEKFKAINYPRLSKRMQEGYDYCYKRSEQLYDLEFNKIKTFHLQEILQESGLSYSTKNKIKSFWNQLFEMAMENDIIHKNYAEFLDIGSNTSERIHYPFTDVELLTLWKNIDLPFADFVMTICMTGMRSGELKDIKCEDVHLEKRHMIGGSKTQAGKDRVIPIHSSIVPLIEKRLGEQEYLFSEEKFPHYNRHHVSHRFNKLMKELNMEHKGHDGRVTFITNMSRVAVDPLTVKRIVGHSSSESLTEKIYTIKYIEDLVESVELLNTLPIFPKEIFRSTHIVHKSPKPQTIYRR